eukprot:CAMPEP_0178897934 /NCGR_PEP_ID=MMETSP0786-20121207/2037_1 /TAXON_ID=186022 /ORGANISM="Thalassionema frauenfeldii, Strain CCMP 1798" /LENGTH=502 /DNA_ID=CAMNT_0020568569 /DNA_START=40 /DNA_END=1549 /DNA_ORIENTATION=+
MTAKTAAGYTQKDINQEVKRLELDGTKISSVVEGRAFINGKYVDDNGSGEWLTTSNPATGRVVAQIMSSTKRHVDLAVTAARQAFETKGVWSDLPPSERKEILFRWADLIAQHDLELAVYDTIEAGKVITDNLEGDVPDTVSCIRYHAEAIDKLYDQVAPTGPSNLGLIVREPVGVVGLIVPWNFPLLMAAWKLAPALATGNCVVLKPAELTSLSALKLGALARAAAALAQHPDVDMVGFTGSTRVGRTILQAAAESNLKRVSLELGGKSPQIVFDDAEEDLERIVPHILSAAFWNQSENCSCGSRLLVQKGIKPKLIQKLLVATNDYVMGDPRLLSSTIGSMISPQHCDKVLRYIRKGIQDGGTCLLGGPQRIHESSGGDFCGLTILDNVSNSSSIAQEEVFGPVLVVIEFATEEEAVMLANDTKYGLAASLYTSHIHRAHRVSRKLRAGNVSVNCFSEGDDTTPFGGYRQSGFVGRDKSILAHEQYQEIKTIWHEVIVEP